MKLVQQYNKLCSPSAGFLVVSLASLLVVLFHQKRHIRNPLLFMLIMFNLKDFKIINSQRIAGAIESED